MVMLHIERPIRDLNMKQPPSGNFWRPPFGRRRTPHPPSRAPRTPGF